MRERERERERGRWGGEGFGGGDGTGAASSIETMRLALTDRTLGTCLVGLVSLLWLVAFIWVFVSPFIPLLGEELGGVSVRRFIGKTLSSGFLALLGLAGGAVAIATLRDHWRAFKRRKQ